MPTSPLQTIVETYNREGFVVVPNVIDKDLVGEAGQHVEWLMKKHPNTRPEALGHTLVAQDPFWVRLVSDDRLLDVVERFVGPNIGLFAAHYISKPPRDGQPVLWHQDGSYWPLSPMEVITIWLAVDDSDRENGCMRVIPRTQHSKLEKILPRNDIPNALSSGMDESLVDESKAVDIILKAGDVSVHHPNLVHGSEANNSARRRAGLTIRYIPTTTRITQTPWPCPFLFRGKAVPGINDYLPFPRYEAGKHMPFRGCETFGR
ncbi:MAG: phytanoyl-CoA dioxygenase family protein [Planctomycetota bacterium]|nr:phytanoyl-CoA dioxygenase family protein [Planctomycetota bacterium]